MFDSLSLGGSGGGDTGEKDSKEKMDAFMDNFEEETSSIKNVSNVTKVRFCFFIMSYFLKPTILVSPTSLPGVYE